MKMHIVIGCCYFHETNKQKQPNLHFGSSLSPAGQCRVSPHVLMDLVNCRNPLIHTNCRFRGKHATTLTNMPRVNFLSRSGPIESDCKKKKDWSGSAELQKLTLIRDSKRVLALLPAVDVSRPSHITTCNESELLTARVGKPRNYTPVFLLLLSPMRSFHGFRRAEWAFWIGIWFLRPFRGRELFFYGFLKNIFFFTGESGRWNIPGSCNFILCWFWNDWIGSVEDAEQGKLTNKNNLPV